MRGAPGALELVRSEEVDREIETGEEFWSTRRLLKHRQRRVVVMTNEGLWAHTESLIRECAAAMLSVMVSDRKQLVAAVVAEEEEGEGLPQAAAVIHSQQP